MDGRSPLILATRVTSRWYGLPIARGYYLLPVNGLKVTHRQLFSCLIFFQLTLNVLLYLLCILPRCIYIVPPAPKFPVSLFVFQLRIFFVDHQTAFPFQISHKA